MHDFIFEKNQAIYKSKLITIMHDWVCVFIPVYSTSFPNDTSQIVLLETMHCITTITRH